MYAAVELIAPLTESPHSTANPMSRLSDAAPETDRCLLEAIEEVEQTVGIPGRRIKARDLGAALVASNEMVIRGVKANRMIYHAIQTR